MVNVKGNRRNTKLVTFIVKNRQLQQNNILHGCVRVPKREPRNVETRAPTFRGMVPDTREWCLKIIGETPNLGRTLYDIGTPEKGHFGART